MARDRVKEAARERMTATGESYMAARAAVLAEHAAAGKPGKRSPAGQAESATAGDPATG